MTEVTAGIPAQRDDVDDPDMTGDALSIEPAGPASVAGTTTGERVSAFASDAAERVGGFATTTAAASGRIASQVVDRLRNNAELAAERGTTTIADEVVEKIAGIAAREIPGVYDLGGDVARVFASVRDRIGLGDDEREHGNRGVQVRLEGRSAAVRVTLVIEYGFALYSVAEKVRANVIGAIENLLGLEVTAVDIVVDDVHVSDTLPESAAASAA
jgi:uncharacterized alkaline shock family protein YloU